MCMHSVVSQCRRHLYLENKLKFKSEHYLRKDDKKESHKVSLFVNTDINSYTNSYPRV